MATAAAQHGTSTGERARDEQHLCSNQLLVKQRRGGKPRGKVFFVIHLAGLIVTPVSRRAAAPITGEGLEKADVMMGKGERHRETR